MIRLAAMMVTFLALAFGLAGCDSDRMAITVRPCIIVGHPLIQGTGNKFTPTSLAKVEEWLDQASQIWIDGSDIAFLRPVPSEGYGYPVVADPITTANPGDRNIANFVESDFEGDVYQTEADRTPSGEVERLVEGCNAAWAPTYPGPAEMPGFPVIFIRKFVNEAAVPASSFLGFVPSLPNSASPSYAAYCGRPYSFAGTLVTSRYAVVAYSYYTGGEKHVPHTLAHEVGHVLMLSHGDGLDNDGNGRFDSTCDFANESQSELTSAPSLMHPSNQWATTITPLQTELARYSGSKIPGTLGEP